MSLGMNQPRWMTVTGWITSILPLLVIAFSAAIKFQGKPEVVSMFSGKYGYPAGALLVLGVVELICALLYLIPQTSILGAILLAGYLGGATATHARAGEPFWAPILIGVFLWGGLFCRDVRLRVLIPLRRTA